MARNMLSYLIIVGWTKYFTHPCIFHKRYGHSFSDYRAFFLFDRDPPDNCMEEIKIWGNHMDFVDSQ